MHIYNITTKLEHAIANDWVQWMQTEHIPSIMQTGLFTQFYFSKLLDTDESDGLTYAVQFFAEHLSDYDQYIQQHSTQLRNEAKQKWGAGFISFRSLMEVIK